MSTICQFVVKQIAFAEFVRVHRCARPFTCYGQVIMGAFCWTKVCWRYFRWFLLKGVQLLSWIKRYYHFRCVDVTMERQAFVFNNYRLFLHLTALVTSYFMVALNLNHTKFSQMSHNWEENKDILTDLRIEISRFDLNVNFWI